MHRNHSKYTDNIVFIDLTLNILLGFAFLFVVAFLYMQPPTQQGKVDPKAEYMILMTWPDENFDDIDLWLRMPHGQRIGYASPRSGLYHLERDDLGIVNDQTYINGTYRYVFNNKEVIVLRGTEPGLHLVNVHFFERHGPTYNTIVEKVGPPYKVVVTLIKLNPAYVEVARRELILSHVKQELSAFQFTLDAEGKVTSITQDDIPFVVTKTGLGTSTTTTPYGSPLP